MEKTNFYGNDEIQSTSGQRKTSSANVTALHQNGSSSILHSSDSTNSLNVGVSASPSAIDLSRLVPEADRELGIDTLLALSDQNYYLQTLNDGLDYDDNIPTAAVNRTTILGKKSPSTKKVSKKAIGRVFSSPYMPSLLAAHANEAHNNAGKLTSGGGGAGDARQRRGSGKLSKPNSPRGDLNFMTVVTGGDTRNSALRHTRLSMYTGATAATHDAHDRNFPVSGRMAVPANYIDPKGNFPAKDAYIDTVKSQFFSLGFSFGSSFQMFLVSLLIMFISTSNNAGPIRELSHEYYPVFRGVFLLSYYFTLYGACLFVWRRAKVDYADCLKVSYAHTYQFVLRGSSSVAYIVFTFFMLFIVTLTGGLDGLPFSRERLKHLWPALAFFVPLLLYLCPYDRFTAPVFGVYKHGFSQRFMLLKELAATLASPFSEPSFHRFFMADVLCSMPKVLPDLQYTLCLYLTWSFWAPPDEWEHDKRIHAYDTCGGGSPAYSIMQLLLSWMPFHIRLWQCLRAYRDTGINRHLWNALKYTLTLILTALSTFRNSFDPATNASLGLAWVVVGIIATAYTFTWDVFFDWGLGNMNARVFLLRDELYFQPAHYYAAVVLNFFMRLGWALVISPEQPYIQQHYILLLGAVEISRRFMWSIFRVEWEHVRRGQHEAAESAKKFDTRTKTAKDIDERSALLGSYNSYGSQQARIPAKHSKDADIEAGSLASNGNTHSRYVSPLLESRESLVSDVTSTADDVTPLLHVRRSSAETAPMYNYNISYTPPSSGSVALESTLNHRLFSQQSETPLSLADFKVDYSVGCVSDAETSSGSRIDRQSHAAQHVTPLSSTADSYENGFTPVGSDNSQSATLTYDKIYNVLSYDPTLPSHNINQVSRSLSVDGVLNANSTGASVTMDTKKNSAANSATAVTPDISHVGDGVRTSRLMKSVSYQSHILSSMRGGRIAKSNSYQNGISRSMQSQGVSRITKNSSYQVGKCAVGESSGGALSAMTPSSPHGSGYYTCHNSSKANTIEWPTENPSPGDCLRRPPLFQSRPSEPWYGSIARTPSPVLERPMPPRDEAAPRLSQQRRNVEHVIQHPPTPSRSSSVNSRWGDSISVPDDFVDVDLDYDISDVDMDETGAVTGKSYDEWGSGEETGRRSEDATGRGSEGDMDSGLGSGTGTEVRRLG